MAGRRRKQQDAGREKSEVLFRREEETLEPEAGLMWTPSWRGEENEVVREEKRGAGLLPPLPETVTSSGNLFPYTLRQVNVDSTM